MSDKVEQGWMTETKGSPQRFLKTAAAGVTAGTIGFPAVMRASVAGPTKLKVQTAWDAGTLGFAKFNEFCEEVTKTSEG